MLKRMILALLTLSLLLFPSACSQEGAKTVKLDPKNPITVTVWHYYNGAIMNAFNEMVAEFNETLGKEKGIIVDGVGMSSVSELEREVLAAANGEVGSRDLPHIFASYADTAHTAETMELLADLEEYLTEKDLAEYLDSFLEEGRIGLGGELRIFPIAKATEALLVNETDWIPFAEANGVTYDDLATLEGVARISEIYYNWTQAQSGTGRALFGRDVMANLFIAASKQFETEIFSVSAGKGTANLDREVLRKIWDCYYLPYIKGHFFSYGRFRSDDAKVGDILAYVGSSSSAAYFPDEVTQSGTTYPINCKVLPVPTFEGQGRVMIQQGAGMVVMKNEAQYEYASVTFLKWFTETDNNIAFSALSGYMPVKKEALDFDTLIDALEKEDIPIDDITKETLRITLQSVLEDEYYTTKAFSGGAAARAVLENHLQDKAASDRETFAAHLDDGKTHAEAVALFDTEENFEAWFAEFEQLLHETTQV